MIKGIREEQIVADLGRSLMEPRITIVGCGGAGNNIVSGLYWNNDKVKTVAINTDEEKLKEIEVHSKLLIGTDVTYGRGTNGSPDIGGLCAELAREAISRVLKDSDIVFIVAGMGGGTGTGAAPIVAEIAQGIDAITFIIAINPFSHEGRRREVAEEGITKLKAGTSNLIILENDRLLDLAGDCSIAEGFGVIEQSINNLITTLGDRITRVLQEQIRMEVSEALVEIETVRVPRPPSIAIPDIIRTKSVTAGLQTPSTPIITPQFLTR